MLISDKVEIELNNKQIKYYEELGYKIHREKDSHYRMTVPKGTRIIVKVSDLPDGSNIEVKVQCDYCGKIVDKPYEKYYNSHKYNSKDSCTDCKVLKSDETIYLKHGVWHNSQLNEVKVAISEANRLNKQIIIDKFSEMDLKIVDDNFEYKNDTEPIEFICNKHPEEGIQTTYYMILRQGGVGCKKCRYDKISKENSYMWKGGITDLSHHLRKKIYNWQDESLKYYKYTCQITGLRYKNIIVHHIYPFIKLLDETLEVLNLPLYDEVIKYSQIDLLSIENKFLELHFKNEIGLPLTREIHVLFHSLYTNRNNTKEQFDEFKENYYKGIYDYKLEDSLKSYNSIKRLNIKDLKQVV